jgi:phage portal protein BeeE
MLLLERPNEKQSHFAFFKLVYSFYKVCGEAFIWLNRGDVTQMVDDQGNLVERSDKEYQAMPIVEMWIIPPADIAVIPEGDDPFKVKGYQLVNNPSIKFNKLDIIHWMDLNLEWDEFSRPQLRGMSPLKPGYKTLTADNSFIDSMVRMAQNDGSKAIAYNKSLQQPNPQQQTQIENVFSDKINNKDRKNSVAALQGDWGLLDLGMTSVDMETLDARAFIYKELCFLLGVPYAFFDSQVTWDNAKARAIEWIYGEIKPDVNELNAELQRVLFPAFGLTNQQAKLCTDFDDLPELQEDKDKQVSWLNKAPLTGNERREALGYDELPDPTMEEITSSDLMYPMDKFEQDLQNQQDIATSAAANNSQNAYE